MTDEEKKAIEYLKYKIEDNRKMLREYEESGNAIGYGTMTDIYKGAICNFTILLNLIEKKDKIIDRMAKYIEDNLTIDEFCGIDGCYADNYVDGHCQKCLNCIIEYFEKEEV